MKGKKKIFIGVGVGVGSLVLVSGLLGKSAPKVEIAGDPKGKLVHVAKVEKKDIQTRIASTGMLVAEQAERVYAKMNAEVKEVYVEIGDTVTKGQELIVFDQASTEAIQRQIEQIDLQIQNAGIQLEQTMNPSTQHISQAELQVMNFENQIAQAKDNQISQQTQIQLAEDNVEKVKDLYDVTKSLFDKGLESEAKLKEAQTNLKNSEDALAKLKSAYTTGEKNIDTLKKQLEQAKYDLGVARNNVSDKTKAQNITLQQNAIANLKIQKEGLLEQLEDQTTVITAPVDGVVASIPVVAGQMVTPGTELVKIISPDKLIAKAEISAYYAAQLEEGLKVNVKYSGSKNVETTGTVTMVSPVATQKTSSNQGAGSTAIPVEITLDDVAGLKEGLLVDLKIITEDVSDVFAVPLLAPLENKEDQSYIFVVSEDGTLEKRDVKEGAADNQFVEVSGVAEGEVVVTNPTEALEDGMKVSYEPFEEVEGDKE